MFWQFFLSVIMSLSLCSLSSLFMVSHLFYRCIVLSSVYDDINGNIVPTTSQIVSTQNFWLKVIISEF